MVGPSGHRSWNGQCSAVSQRPSPLWHFFTHINHISGFSLAGSTAGSIGIALAVIVMISATLAILWFAAKRKRSTAIPGHPHSNSTEPPSINLSGYNTPRPDRDGYDAEQHNPPPRYNDGNGYSGYPPGNAYNGGYNGHSGYSTPPNASRGDVGGEQQAQGRVFV